MTYTCASLFSGGGGFDIGAKATGFIPVCASEYDPAIAAVYAENLGNHIRVGDILEQSPATWPSVDLLHASPPCPNFSTAKTNAAETPHDIALATKVAEFIAVLKPRWFTLENVQAYRKSASFAIICKALAENGYWYDAPILNAANFGVPQTRKRLMLRAVRGSLVPPLPPPTRWVGWHEAIADIIDTLPETEFAEWQLERLPEDIRNTVVFSHSEVTGTGRGEMTGRDAGEPYPTVISGDGHRPSSMARAFILEGPADGNDIVVRFLGNRLNAQAQTEEDEQAEKYKNSFIVDGKPLNYAGDLSITPTPTPTITSSQTRHPFRAFIVPGGNSTSFSTRTEEEPARAIGDTERVGNAPRAWLSQGRVVKMTPRALARFQSFPDSYVLPAKASLACRIIGNAVPPLLAEAVCRSLLR